jgi:hypothetical protein
MGQAINRQGVDPELAVALAVGSARLEGLVTPPDMMDLLGRVARGEMSADDAVQERLRVILPDRDPGL